MVKEGVRSLARWSTHSKASPAPQNAAQFVFFIPQEANHPSFALGQASPKKVQAGARFETDDKAGVTYYQSEMEKFNSHFCNHGYLTRTKVIISAADALGDEMLWKLFQIGLWADEKLRQVRINTRCSAVSALCRLFRLDEDLPNCIFWGHACITSYLHWHLSLYYLARVILPCAIQL